MPLAGYGGLLEVGGEPAERITYLRTLSCHNEDGAGDQLPPRPPDPELLVPFSFCRGGMPSAKVATSR
jgi:hypothetical protein